MCVSVFANRMSVYKSNCRRVCVCARVSMCLCVSEYVCVYECVSDIFVCLYGYIYIYIRVPLWIYLYLALPPHGTWSRMPPPPLLWGAGSLFAVG